MMIEDFQDLSFRTASAVRNLLFSRHEQKADSSLALRGSERRNDKDLLKAES
jgi:hypothetical protein